MRTWLQTETRDWLEKAPPEKLAPPDTVAFALVLLAAQQIPRPRFLAALHRATGVSEEEAEVLASRQSPVVLRRGLSWADAAIGQYELIAVDAVSVIIRDLVVCYPPPGYLDSLYADLLDSSEFRLVTVTAEMPSSQQADDLREHFFGDRRFDTLQPILMMRKKARIFAYLAAKTGGRVVMEPT